MRTRRADDPPALSAHSRPVLQDRNPSRVDRSRGPPGGPYRRAAAWFCTGSGRNSRSGARPWCLGGACRTELPGRVEPPSAPCPTTFGKLVPNGAASIPHTCGKPTRPGSAAARPGSVNRSARTDRTRIGCPQGADRRVPKDSLARHATGVAFPDTPRRSAADPTRCARTGAPADQVLGLPLTAAARRPASPCPLSRRPPCTATS